MELEEEISNPFAGVEIPADIVQPETSTVPAVQPKTATPDRPNAESYTGNKHAAGFTRRYNELPPHDVFVSGCLGKCAVMTYKRPAAINYGIDPNLEGVQSYWKSLKRTDLQLFRESFFTWVQAFTFNKPTLNAGSFTWTRLIFSSRVQLVNCITTMK